MVKLLWVCTVTHRIEYIYEDIFCTLDWWHGKSTNTTTTNHEKHGEPFSADEEVR